MNDYLSWHYEEKDTPKDGSVCFLDIEGTLEIGVWHADYHAWKNKFLGWILEDIDGKVRKWCYVPQKILNYLSPVCGCYWDKDGGRCMGTKEVDVCDCEGYRSRCTYY